MVTYFFDFISLFSLKFQSGYTKRVRNLNVLSVNKQGRGSSSLLLAVVPLFGDHWLFRVALLLVKRPGGSLSHLIIRDKL